MKIALAVIAALVAGYAYAQMPAASAYGKFQMAVPATGTFGVWKIDAATGTVSYCSIYTATAAINAPVAGVNCVASR